MALRGTTNSYGLHTLHSLENSKIKGLSSGRPNQPYQRSQSWDPHSTEATASSQACFLLKWIKQEWRAEREQELLSLFPVYEMTDSFRSSTSSQNSTIWPPELNNLRGTGDRVLGGKLGTWALALAGRLWMGHSAFANSLPRSKIRKLDWMVTKNPPLFLLQEFTEFSGFIMKTWMF